MESQVLDASARGAIEGIILRYGLFYGPENAIDDADDRAGAAAPAADRPRRSGSAAAASISTTRRARRLRRSSAARPGSIYDIVDDQPVSMSEMARTIAETVGAPRPFAVPAWLPRLLAPYMARMLSLAAAAVERQGARRARLAADVSDDPRRACGDAAARGVSDGRSRSVPGAPAAAVRGRLPDARQRQRRRGRRAGRVAALLSGAASPTSARRRRT